jgi:hypothetical protein
VLPGMPPALGHPAFAPYRQWLVAGNVPELAELNRWARDAQIALPSGKPIVFGDEAPAGALAYEAAVARHGIVHVRAGGWHDAMNALVWLVFPKTKAALNARHMQDAAGAAENQRSRARDAATLLDESGIVLVCADPELAQLLRERAWRALFVDRHDAVLRAMQPYAIGHGMLVKLLAPFRAITARTLILPIDAATVPAGAAGRAHIDEAAARAIGNADLRPSTLPPLPVAALPGWDSEGLGARLFDDQSVFRP